jgi:hypothetical protein
VSGRIPAPLTGESRCVHCVLAARRRSAFAHLVQPFIASAGGGRHLSRDVNSAFNPSSKAKKARRSHRGRERGGCTNPDRIPAEPQATDPAPSNAVVRKIQRCTTEAVRRAISSGGAHRRRCRRGDPRNSAASEQSPAGPGYAPRRAAAYVPLLRSRHAVCCGSQPQFSNPCHLGAREADWEFEQAWVLIVTGHWVAVRGRWFVDTWTGGVPVRIADAPRRRKRVRFAYRITVAPS